MLYPFRRQGWASRWLVGRLPVSPGLAEDLAMTIEIFNLTAQIQRWLNIRVARHLEAQAAKFAR
jgi:hypothetical protein